MTGEGRTPAPQSAADSQAPATATVQIIRPSLVVLTQADIDAGRQDQARA